MGGLPSLPGPRAAICAWGYLGFRVLGLGVWGLGFRVLGLGVWGLGFRSLGFRV